MADLNMNMTWVQQMLTALDGSVLTLLEPGKLLSAAFGLRRLSRRGIDKSFTSHKRSISTSATSTALPPPWYVPCCHPVVSPLASLFLCYLLPTGVSTSLSPWSRMYLCGCACLLDCCRYQPKFDRESTVATPAACCWLMDALGADAASSDWKLAYSTDVHGWGLDRLYSKCKGVAPSIVLIEAAPAPAPAVTGGSTESANPGSATASTFQFGFYTPDTLRPNHSTRPASTHLFQLQPAASGRLFNFSPSTTTASAASAASVVGVMCSTDFIAVGGCTTGSHVAIRLDANMTAVRVLLFAPNTPFTHSCIAVRPDVGNDALVTGCHKRVRRFQYAATGTWT